MGFLVHTQFVSSQGDRGWYELKQDNEVIEFRTPVNSLSVEAKDEGLTIKLNNEENYWYVDGGRAEAIEGYKVTKIQVMNSRGTLIRWKGLGY